MKKNNKKAVNIEVKASFQPSSRTKKINSRYLKSYKPVKKDNDKANQDYWDRNKNKSTQNPISANNTS